MDVEELKRAGLVVTAILEEAIALGLVQYTDGMQFVLNAEGVEMIEQDEKITFRAASLILHAIAAKKIVEDGSA